MSHVLSRLLNQKSYLLTDGALATNLFQMGLKIGDAPELWNIDFPKHIEDLAQRFINAGSDILLTNTFGSNYYRLKLHNNHHRIEELNIAATNILVKLREKCPREIIIAGSIGPTGEILEPSGTLCYEDAYNAFKQQADALKIGGVDILWIETFSDINETKAACEAAISTGLPIVYTMSIDTNGRTILGNTPTELIQLNSHLTQEANACGINCGMGLADGITDFINIKKATLDLKTDPILIAKTNCGLPEYINGKISYPGTPVLMADYAKLVFDAGAKIIGGCCGTTPEHIFAMKTALENHRHQVLMS